MRKIARKILLGLVVLITYVACILIAAILSSEETAQTKQPLAVKREPINRQREVISVQPAIQTAAAASDEDAQTISEDGDCGLCRYLNGIEIVRHDTEYEIHPRLFKNISRRPVGIDLDLGESIENQLIILNGTNPKAEFKIEQRFETSLTVMDEGPHLDLTDWKHYRSEWKEISKLEDNKFLTLKLSESDSSRFPAVTMRDVRREVARVSGGKWSRLVRQARTINDYPLGVGVSKVSLRIKVREGGQWKAIKRLDFTIPMGC